MDDNRTSRLAQLISTPPIRLSPVLASIVAGVLGGIVARLVIEFMMMGLLQIIAVILTIFMLLPFDVPITDFGLWVVLTVLSVLFGGLSGGFIASEISRRLSQRTGNLGRWRWAWSITGLVMWSLVAGGGIIYFQDVMFPLAPHPWRSVVLWPLSGGIVGGVLGVLFLNRRSMPSPAA